MKKESGSLVRSSSIQARDNSSGTTSTALGVVAVALSLMSPILCIPLGVAALIFGLIQRRSFSSRWSTAGIILGILAIALGILGIVLFATIGPEILGSAN